MNLLSSRTIAAGLLAACCSTLAQTRDGPGSLEMAAAQRESDWRVIAARCGTPAFERAFLKQSKAMVAAGLVVPHRDPAEVERQVSSLRRNPMRLVGAQAECPAWVDDLRALQAQRAQQLKTSRRPARR